MPLPSCFDILNESYFTNLVLSINAATTETELQILVDKVYADIAMLNSTIESQITLLGPIAALLSPPSASFGSIISWITSMITVLTQLYKPFFTYAAQLTALTSAVATLTIAINDAASLKGFSITIPSIAPVCSL